MESEYDIYPRKLMIKMTQRWPILLGWLSLGFIFGWLVSWVWPAAYQARTDLYISINTDAIYTNPDDYKNSLLRQLNTLVLSDDILEATLEELRYQDPAWDDFSSAQVRSSLEPSWRDSGRWALLVRANDATKAEQIASAWQVTILKEISAIAPHTRNLLILDARMTDLAQNLRVLLQRESLLTQLESAFSNLDQDIAARDRDRALDHLTRWRMYTLFVNAADQNDAWMTLLDRFPDEDAFPDEYSQWITDVLLTIEIDRELLNAQNDALEAELEVVSTQQEAEFKLARGLSANLVIETLDGGQVSVQKLRPAAVTTIIGGLVAATVWLLYFLVGLFPKQGSYRS